MEKSTDIEKLNNKNYRFWSTRMKGILTIKGVREAIEDEKFSASDNNKKEENLCKALIMLNINDQNLSTIDEDDSSYDIWQKIKNYHTKLDSFHTVLTLRDYLNTYKKDSEKINDYIFNKNETYKRLEDCGLKLDINIQIGIMLIGLGEKYEPVMRTIDLNDKNLTIELLKRKLVEEERLIDARHETNEYNPKVNATKIERRWSRTERNEKPNENYELKRETSKDTNEHESLRDVKCYRCNKFGHIGRNCPQYGDHKRFTKRNTSTRDQHERNNDTREKSRAAHTCQKMNYEANSSKRISERNEWLLDSGATDHLTSDRKKLTDFENETANITCAGGESLRSKGKGNMEITWSAENGGTTMTLSDVLYVPELNGNLVSISRLGDANINVNFDKERATLINNEEVIGTAKRKNDVYTMYENKMCLYTTNETTSEIWHKRLGHPTPNESNRLAKLYEIKSNSANDKSCETCNICNIRRKNFPKTTNSRRNSCLELIHTDVIGPINPISRGGNRYVITFTDDFSRYSEVYMIKHKSDALSKFIEYKRQVEKLHDKRIKALRSDNGGEYVNRNFEKYLIEEGIQRELTTPYTPQQNGVAERLNQTLLNITRCLMEESGADDDLWGEALLTANYIRNRRTTTSNNGKTPYGTWTNRNTGIKHMKAFGCRCWYKSNRHMQKYKPQGEKGIFLGYEPYTKAYRIWNDQRKTIIISRDVKFDETCFPMKEKNREFDENVVNWNRFIDPYVENDEDNEEEISESKVQDTSRNEDENEEHSEELDEDSVEQERSDVEEDHLDDNSREITNEDDDSSSEIINEDDESSSEIYENDVEQNVTTRSGRKIKKPNWLQDYSVYAVSRDTAHGDEPKSYKQAISGPENAKWIEAINAEFRNLTTKGTWEIIDRPKNSKILKTMWIFKRKLSEQGVITSYKARLVALGNHEVDYGETFSPVVMRRTTRILLALSMMNKWEIEHVDIEGAYLNAELKKNMFIEIPEGHEDEHLRNRCVLQLKKGLYGLHESGKLWNERLNSFMIGEGLRRCISDPGVYYNDKRNLIISTYVDDLMLHGEKEEIKIFKNKLKKNFNVKELGAAKRVLSINLKRSKNSIRIDQSDYTKSLLNEFGMDECKSTKTMSDPNVKYAKNEDKIDEILKKKYQKAIGGLLYLATNTRPDILHTVTKLSQYSVNPSEQHWNGVKRLLRYLKGTIDYGITYSDTERTQQVQIYTDADWGSDPDRKSYSGYAIVMANGVVSWCSRKQRCVAQSTAEAEFVALSECIKEVKWLNSFRSEITGRQSKKWTINIDNLAAIKMAENHWTSDRTKHIDLKVLLIRQEIEEQRMQLQYVPSEYNLADGLTKTLTEAKNKRMCEGLGIGRSQARPIQGEC